MNLYQNKFAIVLLLSLTACSEFTIGLFGQTPKAPTTHQTTNNLEATVAIPVSYGEVVSCTIDSQCGNNFICFKKANEYVGMCAFIK